jgi:hypothetical protein
MHMGRTKSKLEIFNETQDENIVSKNVQTILFQSVSMTVNLFFSHEDKIFVGTVSNTALSAFICIRDKVNLKTLITRTYYTCTRERIMEATVVCVHTL